MEVRIILNPQKLLRSGDVAGAVEAFRQHWRNRIAAQELIEAFALALGAEQPLTDSSVEPLPWLEYG